LEIKKAKNKKSKSVYKMIFAVPHIQKETKTENKHKKCEIKPYYNTTDETRQINELLRQFDENPSLKKKNSSRDYKLENYLLNESFQLCCDYQTDSLVLKLVEVIYLPNVFIFRLKDFCAIYRIILN